MDNLLCRCLINECDLITSKKEIQLRKQNLKLKLNAPDF